MNRRALSVVVPSLLAAAVAFTLAACGGGSSDSAVTELAGFMPADAAAYIEADIKPEGEVQENADRISKQLAGATLGDLLKGAMSANSEDIDFDKDVKPWLGDAAAIHVDSEAFESGGLSGLGGAAAADSSFGLVVQTSDADGAKSFLEKQSGPGDSGEYKGYSYSTLKGDDSVSGLVDDNLVAANDLTGFKAMVDARKGDSLKDSEGFKAVADKADDDSLLNVYVAGKTEAQGVDYGGLYKALGIDPEQAGGILSMVPEKSGISVRAHAADPPDLDGGDASGLISSFPSDSTFAFGVGNVGKNATKVIEALDKEGMPGTLEPGELGKTLDQISEQGVDARSLIENLDDLGLFVQGDDPQKIGGALVLTSSNLKSATSALKLFTMMAGSADDSGVQPLGGGMTGVRIRTPSLPGRPVVVAMNEKRLVIAIGMKAAKQALDGSGSGLGKQTGFKAAKDSLDGPLAMYLKPAAIEQLIKASSGNDPEMKTALEALAKLSFVAAGTGSGDGTGELNVGVK